MGLTIYQYNQIIRQYDDIRNASDVVLMARRNEISEEIPQYDELEQQAIELSMECAVNSFTFKKELVDIQIAELKKKLIELDLKKRALLKSHGYPENWLDPIYSCPDCKDTGYIGDRRCHCFRQAMVDLVYRQSNIKQVLEKENFDSFNLDYYDKDCIDPFTGESSYDIMKGNYEKALSYVNDFGKEEKVENLILYGTPGLGKTFLSNCIAKALLEKAFSVLYFTSHQFFDVLSKEMKNDDSQGTIATSDYMLDCDLLIIDDLGAELATSFTISKFNYILNERLLRNKATILSTNLQLNDIAGVYGDRNFSRVVGNFTPMYFFGDDIRLKKQLL